MPRLLRRLAPTTKNLHQCESSASANQIMSTSMTFALGNFLGKMLANAPKGKVPETLAEIFIKEDIVLKELDIKNRNRKGKAGNGNGDGATKKDYVPVVHVAKVRVVC